MLAECFLWLNAVDVRGPASSHLHCSLMTRGNPHVARICDACHYAPQLSCALRSAGSKRTYGVGCRICTASSPPQPFLARSNVWCPSKGSIRSAASTVEEPCRRERHRPQRGRRDRGGGGGG